MVDFDLEDTTFSSKKMGSGMFGHRISEEDRMTSSLF